MPSSFHRLCCVIEDEGLVFPVDILAQADIVDLKKKIQSERAMSTLQGIDPHSLKVCIAERDVVCLTLASISP